LDLVGATWPPSAIIHASRVEILPKGFYIVLLDPSVELLTFPFPEKKNTSCKWRPIVRDLHLKHPIDNSGENDGGDDGRGSVYQQKRI
jgi:hypothetical protein